jgi:hypothetical protein
MDPCPVGERGVVLGILLYILLWLRQNPGKISPGTYFRRLCCHHKRAESIKTDPSDFRPSKLRRYKEYFLSVRIPEFPTGGSY